ncbi:MAG: hypothetical protein AB7Q42_13760 [Acidimicrobiia bacterium]
MSEIRVHGVGGANASQLLDDPHAVQVAGDGTAGFHRSRDPGSGHDTEAYVWGGLTSKALIAGFWWLLLPFTLVNVAGWMLQPSGSERRRWPLTLTRAMVRIGGVGLTVVYVLYVAVLSVDVVAMRCGSDPECTRWWWQEPLRWFPTGETGHPFWRATVGIGFVILVVAVLFGVSSRNRPLHDTVGGAAPPTRDVWSGRIARLGDRDFWYQLDSPGALYRTHLAAATATVGFAAGTTLEEAVATAGWPDEGRLRAWLVVVAVLAAGVIGFLARPDRYVWTGSTYADRLRTDRVMFRFATLGWGCAHVGVAVAAGVIGWAWRRDAEATDSFGEHGFIQFVNWIAYGVIGLIGLLLVAAVVRLWGRNMAHLGSFVTQLRVGLGQRAEAEGSGTDRDLDESGFRVYPVPAAMGIGLVLTFAGFSAVLVRLIAMLQTGDTTVILGTSLIGGNSSFFAFSAVITLAVALYWVADRRARRAAVASVRRDYGLSVFESPRREGWVSRVATDRLAAGLGRRADVLLTVFLVVFSVTMLVLLALGGDAVSSPLFGWSWLETAGSWVLVTFLFPGVFVLRAATRARDSRRSVGKVWDVLTFWPRVYHPLAAPCYAERAVPELRDRIRELSEDGGRVIVVAHSQGTVLSYAALELLAADDDDADRLSRVSVVTYGSPIRQLFVPFFPTYFSAGDIQRVASRLDPRGGWVNFYRDTDYVGKHLFEPPAEANVLPVLPGASDVLLLDPSQPELPARTHSGYDQEALVRRWVAAVATAGGLSR